MGGMFLCQLWIFNNLSGCYLCTFLTLTLPSPTCSHLFCRGAIFGYVDVKKSWSRTIQTLLSLWEETVLSERSSCLNNQSHMKWISKILYLLMILPCPLLIKYAFKWIVMLGGTVFLVFMNTMNWTFIYPKLTHPCYPFSLFVSFLLSLVMSDLYVYWARDIVLWH